MDVTRRYVRNPSKHSLDRTRAPEAVLLHIMAEIRALRRNNLSKQEKFVLEGEDMREGKELQEYVLGSIASDICNLSVDDIINARINRPAPDSDAQKALEARTSGNAEWIRARGEGGRNSPNQPGAPDPRNSRR
jgi:peptide-N4-(N-acetyl-beta-glucosaminyl)asparagine amidase